MSPFDERLEQFLEAGEPPVYLGWGSMCRLHNDELCRAAIKACMICGKRGIVLGELQAHACRVERQGNRPLTTLVPVLVCSQGGWARLSLDMLDSHKDAELIAYAEENILFTKKANHILLFPRCCCVVTHGGAGTSAATLRSGKFPTSSCDGLGNNTATI